MGIEGFDTANVTPGVSFGGSGSGSSGSGDEGSSSSSGDEGSSSSGANAGRARAGAAEAAPGLFVHRSNRSEVLVEELTRLLSRPTDSPLDPECIVVQGRGMERWLAMQLSRRLGVWANPDFPFPRSMVDRAFRAVLGEIQPAQARFDPATLLWSVASRLPGLSSDPKFAPIRDYLGDDEDPRKLLQLSGRLATVFDRYTVFRPELVLEWEAGQHDDWQAALWRALSTRRPDDKEIGPGHTAGLERLFHRRVREESGPIHGLPVRIILFGISALPPSYVRVLWSLAQRIQIHLFVLSPSREYWADIRSRREILRRRAARGLGADADPGLQHDEEGHPLLASLGRLQRDFQQVLELHTNYQETERDLYQDPVATGQKSMLTVLQSDILALRHRRPNNAEAPPVQIDPGDRSITVHSCHGPTRELEVLQDQLRDLFEADATLAPHDVVVMTPDIEAYAPLIEAVFGGAARAPGPIPYQVADRSTRATHEVVEAFMAVLDLLQGRLSAPEVLDLLALDPVRQAFDIGLEELSTIRAWVAGAAIRWGEDADHQEEVGQPGHGGNTWRFGLDRLFLGYAMPSSGRDLFAGVLPFDDVEGSDAPALGLMAELCEALSDFRKPLSGRHTVSAWQELLERLLERMVATTEDNAQQHQRVRDALAALTRGAAAGDFDALLPLRALRPLLAAELERGGSARGFLAGGVTFCQLMPMRSIPFRVVCLLGMNDGAFPRTPQAPGFDRIAAHPRVGDRSPRDDDRYLMLEALLSARERLLVTYVGQSIHSNMPLPPAPLVGELVDTLEASFRMDPAREGEDVREHVLVAHPLQPFSPRYFGAGDDQRLFSYSDAGHEGARSLTAPREPAPPFLSAPLPGSTDAPRVVALEDLVRFFHHPARALLQGRLGLHLDPRDEAVEGREPLVLAGLERWRVGTELLERALAGEELSGAWSAVRGAGVLPPGPVGRLAYARLSASAAAAERTWRLFAGKDRLEPAAVDGELHGIRLTGTLDNLWPDARVCVRFSGLEGPWELDVWVRHVVLCWLGSRGLPRRSVAISCLGAEARAIRFEEVAQPERVLSDLVGLYLAGQSVPLPFFPRASRAYQKAARKAAPDEIFAPALSSARGLFSGSHGGATGEMYDPYVQQVFGDSDPLEPGYRPCQPPVAGYADFPTAARTVFAPLLDHRTEVSG